MLPPAKNSIGGPWTKTFVYDDLYRLTSSTGTHTIATGPTFTYSFGQSYNSIHNITHKTQTAMQNGAVNPQTTYDFAYTYPAPGSARPHAPTAIGPFTITNDADGNQIRTLGTGTSDQSQYLYDEENRLACANKGPQTPSPSCDAQAQTKFVYDHAGVRKIKLASTPTIYPNQYYTDFGGGAGNQFKHIFIGGQRLLTKKARVAPDRQHWYYHPDHLGSTGTVTNENGQMVDAVHYFPYGEVWLEEVPASLPVDYFFTAKELDQETGFYNFGARYLDPRFSKWMTADPVLGDYMSGKIQEGVFDPRHLALYTYSLNNPAVYFDPNGLWEWKSFGYGVAKGAAIGIGVGLFVGATIATGGAFAVVGYSVIVVGTAATAYAGAELATGRTLTIDANGNLGTRELTDAEYSDTAGQLAGGVLVGGPAARLGAAGARLALARFAGRDPVGPAPGPRGRCSFAEGTPVVTDDGLKSISELKTGERVLTRSEDTGTYAFQPITQVFRHEDPVKLHLTLEDPATGVTEVIDTTPEHPFNVPGRGFVPAGSLKPDDAVSRAAAGTFSLVRLISGQSGTSEALLVKNLTFENQPFLAYNLEVGEDHTFFVGTSHAWVHNIKCGDEELQEFIREELGDTRVGREDLENLTLQGPRAGQRQGRQFRRDWLEVNEWEPDQPAYVRGWLRHQRLRDDPNGPRNPPGVVQAHGNATRANEGFSYGSGNTRLQGADLNSAEEVARARLGLRER